VPFLGKKTQYRVLLICYQRRVPIFGVRRRGVEEVPRTTGNLIKGKLVATHRRWAEWERGKQHKKLKGQTEA